MNTIKKYLPHASFVAAGVVLGLAIATTKFGASVTTKIAGLRAKAGV